MHRAGVFCRSCVPWRGVWRLPRILWIVIGGRVGAWRRAFAIGLGRPTPAVIADSRLFG